MPLALFDLDNTLLAGDSDYLWGEFLCAHGYVDAAAHRRENGRFYRQYLRGALDIRAWLAFQLRPLAENDVETLHRWRARFVAEAIRPILLPKGRALIDAHREAGDLPLIITSTNRFIVAPIAAELGVNQLIATEPRLREGRYTGEVDGVPAFREGKVERLAQWCAQHDATLAGSLFYSDSHNDLPLLERVERPVAVDPDERLAATARERGWPILSLREAEIERDAPG